MEDSELINKLVNSTINQLQTIIDRYRGFIAKNINEHFDGYVYGERVIGPSIDLDVIDKWWRITYIGTLSEYVFEKENLLLNDKEVLETIIQT